MSETTPSTEHQKESTGQGSTEEYVWRGADSAAGGGSNGEEASRATAKEWLAQLEHMIESLATQAAPVIRQVGAKAAELAALAAEKAGPIAHRAAELTEVAGAKVAERSRQLAEELRREREPEAPSTEAPSGEAAGTGEGEPAQSEEGERRPE